MALVAAGWSVAYAPATNLERLDVAPLGSTRASIDMAAYVLTDVSLIDALATAGAHRIRVWVYRQLEDFPAGGPWPRRRQG